MNKTVKLILYGFLIWLVPFLASLVIFPLKTSMNPLFESIMPVIITITVVTFTYMYFKPLLGNYISEGVKVGLIWIIISLAIDLLLFLPPSPMQMSLTSYIMDIGITYLMIPIITIGSGYLLSKKSISE